MKVIWTPQAWKGLQRTARYLRQEFGRNRRQRFMDEMLHMERLLSQYPHIGPIEPLLADYLQMYRGIVVNSLNKLIYRVDGDIVYIVALWDTRRDPESLIADVKKFS